MRKQRILILVLIVGILVAWKYLKDDDNPQEINLKGTTMGTITYSVKYIDEETRSFQSEVDSILVAFNAALSTYIAESEISQFNRKDSIQFHSSYLYPVFEISQQVYKQSGGAFDPTVGSLVNAWGFGKNKNARMDSTTVDSLLQLVGYDQVIFDPKGATMPKGVSLDFSASAKGYAVDVVAEFLKSKNIDNYMVEIGGEVACKGKNINETVWKIGINKPSIDAGIADLFATAFIKDQSIATSGNYRNYYLENGKMISHTIDPFTGYPVTRNLLSASIFAKNCTLADGFATACMVLGKEKSIEMIERVNEIEGFLIYSDENGKILWYVSPGIAAAIEVLN